MHEAEHVGLKNTEGLVSLQENESLYLIDFQIHNWVGVAGGNENGNEWLGA